MLSELGQKDATRVRRAIVRMQDISASVRRAIATIRTEIYHQVRSVASGGWTAQRSNKSEPGDASEKLGPHRITMDRVRQVMKSRIAQLEGLTYRVRLLERSVNQHEKRVFDARTELARFDGQQLQGPTMRLNLNTGVGSIRASQTGEGTRRQQAMLQFSRRKSLASPSALARLQALDHRRGVHDLTSPQDASRDVIRRIETRDPPPDNYSLADILLSEPDQISPHEQRADASLDAAASPDSSYNEDSSQPVSSSQTVAALVKDFNRLRKQESQMKATSLEEFVEQVAWFMSEASLNRLISRHCLYEPPKGTTADRAYHHAAFCEKVFECLVAACDLLERNIKLRQEHPTIWTAYVIELNIDYIERKYQALLRTVAVCLSVRCQEPGATSFRQQMIDGSPWMAKGVPILESLKYDPEWVDKLLAILVRCITLLKNQPLPSAQPENQSSTSSISVSEEIAQTTTWNDADPLESLETQPVTWNAADPIESLEAQPELTLPHLTTSGAAHMVNVGNKASTQRIAIAQGRIRMRIEVLRAIENNTLKKGDAISVARLAGIMGAKRCSDLIPLCHPIAISGIEVGLFPAQGAKRPEFGHIYVHAAVITTGQTGVEMEALSAVNAAVLTVYDMIKSVDKAALISGTFLSYKDGGRSGRYVSPHFDDVDKNRFVAFVAGSPTLSSLVVLGDDFAPRREAPSGRASATSSPSLKITAKPKSVSSLRRSASSSRRSLPAKPPAQGRVNIRRTKSSRIERPLRMLRPPPPPARPRGPPPTASSSGLERVLDDY